MSNIRKFLLFESDLTLRKLQYEQIMGKYTGSTLAKEGNKTVCCSIIGSTNILWETGLKEDGHDIKIGGRNINNLLCTDSITSE